MNLHLPYLAIGAARKEPSKIPTNIMVCPTWLYHFLSSSINLPSGDMPVITPLGMAQTIQPKLP